MDDGKATPLGKNQGISPKGVTVQGRLANDISLDTDQLLAAYAERLQHLKTQLIGVSDFARAACMAQFNETWMYGTDMRIYGRESVLLYHVKPHAAEAVETYKHAYLKRVLNLCLRTDICAKLGMSLMDFMTLEFPVFEYIEKSYYEHKPMENEMLGDLVRQMEQDAKKKKA